MDTEFAHVLAQVQGQCVVAQEILAAKLNAMSDAQASPNSNQ